MDRTSTSSSAPLPVPWGPEQKRLLARARRDDDREALEDLVRQMLPLARRLARKYQNRREPLEDLVQVASLALLKAIERFDPDRGIDFPAFAVPTITGELKRYYRDYGWGVHVPRTLQEHALKVDRELHRLTSQLGRSPTPAELAARCHLPVEEVLESRLAIDAYAPHSLDVPAGDDADEPRPMAAGEEPGYRLVEDLAALQSAMRALPPRERRIVALRFGEELSQQEIADCIGISQMHVSRLLRRALARLGPILAQAA